MKRKNTNKNIKIPTPKDPAKKAPKKPFDKRILLIGGGALIAVIVLTLGLIRFYSEPLDSVVARINGIDITGWEVSREIMPPHEAAELYFFMFPDDTAVDHDRIVPSGVTFARYLREDAVRSAALTAGVALRFTSKMRASIRSAAACSSSS